MHDHNTFDSPDKVNIKQFNDALAGNGAVTVRMPPKSVITLEIV
jgi:alpha-L-arabinofuranosidase